MRGRSRAFRLHVVMAKLSKLVVIAAALAGDLDINCRARGSFRCIELRWHRRQPDFRLHPQSNRLAPGLMRFDGSTHGFFNRALRAGKVALMQPHASYKCEERTAMERGADLIAKHDALAEFLAGRGIVPA